MPAKGTRKLTDQQKVDIVVQKQVKPKKTDTYAHLAQSLDVSDTTIRRTTLESLSEKQRALYDETVKNLKFSSLSLTAKAIEKSEELVEQADSTRDLAGVVAAGKFGHDVYRLETNQSTQNIAHGREKTPDEVCRAYVDGLIGQGATIEQALIALEAVPVLNGASVEDRARYAGGQRVAWKLGG